MLHLNTHSHRLEADAEHYRRRVLRGARHFALDEWRRRMAEKRGGGYEHISLCELIEEPSVAATPVYIIETAEFGELVDREIAELEREYLSQGRGAASRCSSRTCSSTMTSRLTATWRGRSE